LKGIVEIEKGEEWKRWR